MRTLKRLSTPLKNFPFDRNRRLFARSFPDGDFSGRKFLLERL